MDDINIKELDFNKDWTVHLNKKIMINNKPPYRKININNVIIAEYIIGDHFNEALALVNIIKNDAMSISDLADCFGLDRRTIHNYIHTYDIDGLEGLRPSKNYRGKINNELINFIQKLQNSSTTITCVELNRELSKKFNLIISKSTIKRLEKAELIKPIEAEVETGDGQLTFDNVNIKDVLDIENEFSEQQIYNNILKADSVDETVKYTRYGGYLIYSTMIQTLFKGTFEYVEQNLSCKNIFKTWDVKNLIYTYLLYFLIGITNIEQTKTINRKELGCLLGEAEAPCSKTLKRNMKELMKMDLPEKMQDYLVKAYIELGYVEIGKLYYDGHFVPYYGNKDIGKGFFTQRRLAVPGHEQYWANDAKGRPVFFISSYGFSRFGTAIIELTEKALKYISEFNIEETLQIAFDRGGYNKELFNKLSKMSVVWSTWKVGATKNYAETEFNETFILETEKETVEYGILYTKHKMTGCTQEIDAAVILNKKLNKQITILYFIPENAKDKYTPLDAVKFLLNRWKQENFFKYSLENQDINQTFGLLEGTDDDAYYVPNPEYLDLETKKRRLLNTLELQESKKEDMKLKYFMLKKKITFEDYIGQKCNSKIISSYDETIKVINDIETKLQHIEVQIPYTKKDGSTYAYLNFSKMNLMNTLKAAVYNMNWHMRDISKMIFKDYREISKFLTVLTETGGYYKAGEDKDELILNRLELPAYQSAAEILIEKINSNNPTTLGRESKPLFMTFKKSV